MRNSLRTMLLAATLTLCGGVASAGPLEDAEAAYDRKDYAKESEKAFPIL